MYMNRWASLVAAVMAYVVMLIQAAPTMAAALVQGGLLQVLQALAWLGVYALALGGAFLPIWLLQHIVELLGPLGGLMVFALILVGAWKLLPTTASNRTNAGGTMLHWP